MRKFINSAAALIAIFGTVGGFTTSASAQFFPHYTAPIYHPMQPPRPMISVPHYHSAPQNFGFNGGHVIGQMGPALGAGAARGLMGLGVPAPVATWGGNRINENAQSAYRERSLGDAAIRTGTGISIRDIEDYGWRGGPNSEVNRVMEWFGF